MVLMADLGQFGSNLLKPFLNCIRCLADIAAIERTGGILHPAFDLSRTHLVVDSVHSVEDCPLKPEQRSHLASTVLGDSK